MKKSLAITIVSLLISILTTTAAFAAEGSIGTAIFGVSGTARVNGIFYKYSYTKESGVAEFLELVQIEDSVVFEDYDNEILCAFLESDLAFFQRAIAQLEEIEEVEKFDFVKDAKVNVKDLVYATKWLNNALYVTLEISPEEVRELISLSEERENISFEKVDGTWLLVGESQSETETETETESETEIDLEETEGEFKYSGKCYSWDIEGFEWGVTSSNTNLELYLIEENEELLDLATNYSVYSFEQTEFEFEETVYKYRLKDPWNLTNSDYKLIEEVVSGERKLYADWIQRYDFIQDTTINELDIAFAIQFMKQVPFNYISWMDAWTFGTFLDNAPKASKIELFYSEEVCTDLYTLLSQEVANTYFSGIRIPVLITSVNDTEFEVSFNGETVLIPNTLASGQYMRCN